MIQEEKDKKGIIHPIPTKKPPQEKGFVPPPLPKRKPNPNSKPPKTSSNEHQDGQPEKD